MGKGLTSDPVLEALDQLVGALRENIAASESAIEWAGTIKRLRGAGRRYRDILEETGPLAVAVVAENTRRLHTHGSRLRRAQAAALHAEGMTMDRIADLFGVSRQRISTILRNADRGPSGAA